ncbi:MAG TPA: DUF4390 domain-containing protein [Thermoanaerobaculia bacterium]|nr:DUF4390 domain-containing protein [Thermoanaerobaculia bacterium]
MSFTFRGRSPLLALVIGAWASVGSSVAPTPDVAPDDPDIAVVSTFLSGRDLKVTARLSPALPKDVETRLVSGLPTTTVWRVALYISRPLWFDGKKDERRYEVTATYRPAAGDFSLERRLDGRLLETRVVPSREEAGRALSELAAVPCFRMGEHLVGKPLVVRVRCAYAPGVALGVIPTTFETGWSRSTVFQWDGRGGEAP